MSTTTTAPVNAKINTIQSIEGAKGNIALFYYQGKYPIYKSLDDGLYNLNSVIDAFKASTNIDIAKYKVTKWLSNDATKRLIAYLCKIDITKNPPVEFSNWYDSSKSKDIEAFLLKFQKRTLSVLVKKWQQTPELRYLDGWYGCEKLMLDLAGWLDKGFHCEIYDVFAMSAERDRLNTDINHKQSTIDELREMLARQEKRLEYVIEQNDDLLDRADTIQTHVEAMSPIVTSLKNRVSTISDEHLLVYATDDTGDTTRIKIHAVNTSTMKARGYKLEDAIAYIAGGNTVNVQNELYRLILDRGMNIGRINRKEKCFTIRRIDLDSLKQLIEQELNSRINSETESLNKTAKTIESTAPKRVKKATEYMGYPLTYCRSVCDKWSISKEVLTEIINEEWCYNVETKPIILHKNKGILYKTRVKGKPVYKPVPTTYFSGEA